MDLKIERTDGCFELEGELDMATAPDLAELLRETGSASEPILLDFSRISFMDSSGLRVILEAAAERNGGGGLVILHPRPQVQRVLDISIPGGTPGLEVRP
ncbi:MAG TPA: STAS domain-containing protein [Actinomycetota bacterium]|nr:STAS domain-containing protein [Actinomycetota bacterium]